ncbi:hypothetical protein [Edwardsiella anguillarum]|uniref:hypothetical protein n=1 Tax=Edwardsiella anguillarum TaxID=1821960 RepID=UPI00130E2D24|nr:hypothetical protein [Edwardsiella anguillarum]
MTIIGIVFPLVVGLISVLFQKKSSRIHIQSAYQLHSGYMFAGLSGLSLAAFILIGGMVSSIGDKYLDVAFAITALVWMLFNISLSIWFFITSLNILDDKKRDRLMLKYFQSEIVSNYIIRSQIDSSINYLSIHIDKQHIKGIEIVNRYDSNMHLIHHNLHEDKEIRDVKLWLVNLLFRRLKPVKGKTGKIIITSSLKHNKNKITLLASSDVIIPRYWTFLFKICFIKGPKENRKAYRNITRDFYGEAYDALSDRNISTFIAATDRLIETYTTLKKSFQCNSMNYLDKYNDSGSLVTFSQSFHHDFYAFNHEAVKSLETTGEYFRKIIDVPFSIYRELDCVKINEFQQCIQSLFYLWHALINWRSGYGDNLSISQEQRYRELIRCLIGEWESWYMWRRPNDKSEDRLDDYSEHLLYHLNQTAQIAMTAIMADDRFASDHSSDMLLLWFSQNRFEQHFEEYRWHSFFLTPSYLTMTPDSQEWLSILRGYPYSYEAAQSIIFSNALADIRLLTAGYIISHVKQRNNIRLKEVIKRLLKSELVYPTGANDQMTATFTSATDIIDSIIRLGYQQDTHKGYWYEKLSDLVEKFSAYNETKMISGRIHMGIYEDVSNIYEGYTDIAFYLSSSPHPVSRRVLNALNDNIFSYHRKERIIFQLERMKRDKETSSRGYLMSKEEFKNKINFFNETLDAYIQAFNQSLYTDLLNADIDTARLKKTDLTLTQELPQTLTQNTLLSHFSFRTSEDSTKQWETKCICTEIPKNIISRDINSNFFEDLTSISNVEKHMLHNVYHRLLHLSSSRTEIVHDVEELLKNLREITSDEDNYTLILFGTYFGQTLRELTHHENRHSELGITLNTISNVRDLMPIRVNNCDIYQVWRQNENHSLLIRNSIFGDIYFFSDSDNTLFNSSWQSSDENPLEGIVTTCWKQEMEIKGSAVARFEHL